MRQLSRLTKIILAVTGLAAVTLGTGVILIIYLAVNYTEGIRLANQGYRAVALGNYKAAIPQFDAALKKPLGNYQRSYVYLNRGAACNHEQRFTESIHDHTEGLRLNPKLTFAYEGRACAYRETGEIDKALADLNQALRQRDSSEYGYYARGMIFYDRKDYDHALADFEEAVRCSPRNADPVIMRGLCYLAKNDLDRALASFDAAIAMAPDKVAAYAERSLVYQRKGEYAKSARDSGEAARLMEPRSRTVMPLTIADKAHLLLLQADTAYDDHDYDHAIQLANEAIVPGLKPEMAAVLVMNRGNAYSAKGDREHAMHDYNEAIGLDPKNAGAYVNRARLFGRNGHYVEALKDYETAIRLNPGQWQAYFNRALDLRDSGSLDNALADLDKVTELNPTFVSAYLTRADIHIRRKESQEAIRDCDTAASIDPKSVTAYRARARAHSYKHEYAAALQDLEEAAQIETQHPESTLNALAWLRATCPDAGVRDGQKAIAAATKACELTHWQNSYEIDTLAAAHAEAGQFEEAIKYQQKALELALQQKDNASGGMRQRLALYQHHQPYHQDAKE